MKKMPIIITISMNMLIVSLIVLLSMLRYQVAVISGNYNNNMWSYIPMPLLVIVIVTFAIELYIAIKKED